MRPAIALALAVAVMAPVASPSASAAAQRDCARVLHDYDRASRMFANSSPETTPFNANIERAAQRAREAGCVSGARALDGMPALGEALQGRLRGESGAPIRPTWLQVGVVSGIVGELEARAFFRGLGYTVRSRGAPALGRRIFIGPFGTEGGLAEAAAVARRAGFAAPYAQRF